MLKCEEGINKWLVREACREIAKCISRLKIPIKGFRHSSFNSNTRTVWESILNSNRTLNSSLELTKTSWDPKEVNKYHNLNKGQNLGLRLLVKRAVLRLDLRKGQVRLDYKNRLQANCQQQAYQINRKNNSLQLHLITLKHLQDQE